MARVDFALQAFLDLLEHSGSSVVLGAGASAGLVPFGTEFGNRVRKRVLDCGIYPARVIPRDEVADRILGRPREDIAPWDEVALIEEELVAEHISPAAVHAGAIALLSRQVCYHVPPHYAVFNTARHRLSLINYNLDGLASEHCSRHLVVDVHGTGPSAAQLLAAEWESLIDDLQEFYPLCAPNIPRLFLPQRESLELGASEMYGPAARILRRPARLGIVGYSFGGDDDVVAYALVRNTLRYRGIPAVVVDPNAVALAGRLSDSGGCPQVHALPMFWDVLACAILQSRGNPRRRSCDHLRLCHRCIDYTYNLMLDSGRSGIELNEQFELTARIAA